MTAADTFHLDAWLGAIAVLLAALIGAVITVAVQNRIERNRQLRAARVDIYFKLLELNSYYFWVASSQMRGDMPRPQMLEECWRKGWEISDLLRRNDQVEHLDEILTILFDQTVTTAAIRAKRLDSVIDAYGKLVNPAYSKHIQRISAQNVTAFASGLMSGERADAKSFAPCAIDPSLRFMGAERKD